MDKSYIFGRKKCNLGGPDGLGYYWHDLWKKEKRFSTGQVGGGSIMLWECITFYIVGLLVATKERKMLQSTA